MLLQTLQVEEEEGVPWVLGAPAVKPEAVERAGEEAGEAKEEAGEAEEEEAEAVKEEAEEEEAEGAAKEAVKEEAEEEAVKEEGAAKEVVKEEGAAKGRRAVGWGRRAVTVRDIVHLLSHGSGAAEGTARNTHSPS